MLTTLNRLKSLHILCLISIIIYFAYAHCSNRVRHAEPAESSPKFPFPFPFQFFILFFIHLISLSHSVCTFIALLTFALCTVLYHLNAGYISYIHFSTDCVRRLYRVLDRMNCLNIELQAWQTYISN